MRILFINGSPRKNSNTAAVLQRAMKGAESEGSEIKLINLYGLNYKGCVSCFACKRINGPSFGKCVIGDDLKAVLNSIANSDGVIFGTPIYFGQITAGLMALYERLAFQYYQYDPDHVSTFDKKLALGFMYTMNVPEEFMRQAGYPDSFNSYQKLLGTVINQEQSTLYVCNTYQFDDYSKYASKMFREEDKAKYRDEHFETDLQNAFNLGADMARKLKAQQV